MEVVHVAPVPAADGALGQAGFGIENNPALVEVLFDAQAVAATAGAGGIVKGK